MLKIIEVIFVKLIIITLLHYANANAFKTGKKLIENFQIL
jgi:hypothetical protein